MSHTLFWYVFKDLLRIFLLTVLALAGIMSFGGLLRPLTQNGLEASQAGRMLGYLLPAMTTYSLPIAALFATTMVYGRLSADNELTACRAGGISYLSIATPAFLLGLVVSISSLLLLCFIVPGLTLQAEKIIRSNIARFVTTTIQRNHQIRLENYTIYAQDAQVGESDPGRPQDQVVILIGPMFVNYQATPRDAKGLAEVAGRDSTGKVARELENKRLAEQRLATLRQAGRPETASEVMEAKADSATAQRKAVQYATEVRIPREFWMARQAKALITNDETNHRVTLVAQAMDGNQFPRNFAGGNQGGVATADFGPINLPSPVREHPKFMDIRQLKALLADRRQSAAIRELVASFIRTDQELELATQVIRELNSAGAYTFDTGTETYVLTRGNEPAIYKDGMIVVASRDPASRTAKMNNRRGNASTFAVEANQIRVRPLPDNVNHRVSIAAEFIDAALSTADTSVPHAKFTRTFNIPMSESLNAITARTPESYLGAAGPTTVQRETLRRAFVALGNYIQSEMHARTSFAISCLILVMTGACLGMMFKSGNFLSAFAVSVIPALICIILIVTGQHTVENLPEVVTATNNPLNLGIALIWSGNVMVLIIGGSLLWRLQRQ